MKLLALMCLVLIVGCDAKPEEQSPKKPATHDPDTAFRVTVGDNWITWCNYCASWEIDGDTVNLFDSKGDPCGVMTVPEGYKLAIERVSKPEETEQQSSGEQP